VNAARAAAPCSRVDRRPPTGAVRHDRGARTIAPSRDGRIAARERFCHRAMAKSLRRSEFSIPRCGNRSAPSTLPSCNGIEDHKWPIFGIAQWLDRCSGSIAPLRDRRNAPA
jgi:hypothetical protein